MVLNLVFQLDSKWVLYGNPVGLIVGTLLTVGLNVGELVEGKEVRELPPPHEQHASLAVYPKFE